MSSDALKGASLAFENNKRKDDPLAVSVGDRRKEWDDQGALIAATATAEKAQARSRDQSQNGLGVGGYVRNGSQRQYSQQPMGSFSTHSTGSSLSHDSFLPPNSRSVFDLKSPSLIAATLAASRSVSPNPLERHRHGDVAVDATSIAPTRSLISTFERGTGEERKKKSPPRNIYRDDWIRRASGDSARTDNSEESIPPPRLLAGATTNDVQSKSFVNEVRKRLAQGKGTSEQDGEENDNHDEGLSTLSRSSTVKARSRQIQQARQDDGKVASEIAEERDDDDDGTLGLSRTSTVKAHAWPLQEDPPMFTMEDLVNEAVQAAKTPRTNPKHIPKQAETKALQNDQATRSAMAEEPKGAPPTDPQLIRPRLETPTSKSTGQKRIKPLDKTLSKQDEVKPVLRAKPSIKKIQEERPDLGNKLLGKTGLPAMRLDLTSTGRPEKPTLSNHVTPVKRVETQKAPAPERGPTFEPVSYLAEAKVKTRMTSPAPITWQPVPEIMSPKPQRVAKPALEAATHPQINLQAPIQAPPSLMIEPKKASTTPRKAQRAPTPPRSRSFAQQTPRTIVRQKTINRNASKLLDDNSSEDSFVSASTSPSPERFPVDASPPLRAGKSVLHSAPGSPTRASRARRPRRSTSASTNNLVLKDLTNAIVAGSLASSRITPHNTGSHLPPPTLPPRVKSPHLRQTLRQHEDPIESEPDRHKKSHLRRLKKGKHAHHEGSRKKWRDKMTPRERKRYEALWQSNRGILLPGANNSPSREASEYVSNIVIRQVWKRSRLPDDELAEVWDAVDREGRGALHRFEFVVGLWLIDQRLKGRKIPQKVSESVWASANGMTMSGMKAKGT